MKITCNEIVSHRFGLAFKNVPNETIGCTIACDEAKVLRILDTLNATSHISELFVQQNLFSVRADQSQLRSPNLRKYRTQGSNLICGNIFVCKKVNCKDANLEQHCTIKSVIAIFDRRISPQHNTSGRGGSISHGVWQWHA